MFEERHPNLVSVHSEGQRRNGGAIEVFRKLDGRFVALLDAPGVSHWVIGDYATIDGAVDWARAALSVAGNKPKLSGIASAYKRLVKANREERERREREGMRLGCLV